MKKANIVIAFDEEKLAAVRMYMSQRELDLILILDKIVIKEQRCAIIVKGDNYGEEIRNQRRRIE